MEDTIQLLKKHAEMYQKMQPTDAVKLLYQSEFGGGHIIKDKESSLAFLSFEYNNIEKEDSIPLYTKIGGGFVRLNLASKELAGIPLDLINGIFAASASLKHGNLEHFKKELAYLEKATKDGVMPFGLEKLEEYLLDYKDKGYPMVSHSETFRNEYKPAYRIVDSRYIELLPLIKGIDRILKEKDRAVVAIDGRCGSGKSTAAMLLSLLYDESYVVKMDDFFLPFELRTQERMKEPGGNVHYERFLTEVIKPLKENREFDYNVFDCSVMELNGKKHVGIRGLIIVEGSYSMRPELREVYDLTAFVDVDADEQIKRLIAREGDYYSVFREKWIPLEEKYIGYYKPELGCDTVLMLGTV